MDECDELSLNELRGLVKRLHVRLEQYEIHAGSLSEIRPRARRPWSIGCITG